MTTKEKIEALDNLIGMVDDNHGTDYDEALKSAKRSLEVWDNVKTNGDVIMAMFPTVDTYFSNVIDMKLWWNAKYKGGGE